MRQLRAALLLAFLMSSALCAQVASWDALLAKARTGENALPARSWILALSPGAPDPMKDERLLPFLLDGGLRTLPVPVVIWGQLRQEHGWSSGVTWTLLDPDGKFVRDGVGQEDFKRVIEGMESAGFVPTFVRRRAFLKTHPEHGEAWVEELGFAASLARFRFQAWIGHSPTERAFRSDPKRIEQFWSTFEPSKAHALFTEGLEAIRRLAEVPGWGPVGFPFALPRLEFLSRIQELRQPALALESKLRQEMEALDPFLLDLNMTLVGWLGMAKLAGLNAPERLEAIREPDGGIQRVEAFFWVRLSDPNPDPEKLIPVLDRLLESQARGALDADPSQTTWTQAQGRLLRAELLLRAGHPDSAASEIEHAHRLVGRAWEGYASAAKTILELARVPLPESITRILEAKPLPDPPPPKPIPPLALCILDPKALGSWQEFLRTEPFAPWNPKELTLSLLPVAEADRWRKRLAANVLGWVLTRGDQVVAKGEDLPEARALANLLESAAPSAVQRLSAYLSRNPDHLGARAARRRILLGRMPNRWLEPLLAEDCLATLMPPTPKPEGWLPDPAIWSWTARKALPLIERKVESWPRQTPFWSAWLGWSELDASAPSPLGLAQRVQVWPPDRGLQGDLPTEVHKAVAKELRRQGRFEDLRSWFKAAWEAQDRSSWSELVTTFPDQNSIEHFRKQRREVVEAIVVPYRESLAVLRRDSEWLALEREIADWIGEPAKPKGSTR